MNTKQVKILIGFGIFATLVLITIGNGCSKRNGLTSASFGAASNSSAPVAAPAEEPINPNVKTVSLVYSKSFLDQITSCAGVKSPSDTTVRVYKDKSASLSTYGHPSSTTGPQLMSSINIVAEVCNDLIQQEKKAVTPHIFVNWNLNTSAGLTQAPNEQDVKDAISRLTLSCWQKAPSTEEMRNLLALSAIYNEDTKTMPTREVSALMICTVTLASLYTLVN